MNGMRGLGSAAFAHLRGLRVLHMDFCAQPALVDAGRLCAPPRAARLWLRPARDHKRRFCALGARELDVEGCTQLRGERAGCKRSAAGGGAGVVRAAGCSRGTVAALRALGLPVGTHRA